MKIIITDAGRAALVNAGHNGSAPVIIAAIGVTATGFAPGRGLAALPGELKRLQTFGGQIVGADIMHVTIRDETADTYSMRGFALYLGDGTLFAAYGQADVIVEKSAVSMALLAADIQLAPDDAALIQFGSTEFLNPPATTEVVGVVELATDDETTTGTDARRAVTPKGLAKVTAPLSAMILAVQTALGGKSNVGHGHNISDVAGLQTALDGKLSTTGTAASAQKLAVGRQIKATGDVAWAVNFDGSADVVADLSLNDKAVTPSKMSPGAMGWTPNGSTTIKNTTADPNVLLVSSGQTGITARSNVVLRLQSLAAGRDVAIQLSDNVANAAEIGMLGGALYFATGGAERARIDPSGRLGIGTTTPIDNFDLAGVSRIRLGVTAAQVVAQATNGAANQWADYFMNARSFAFAPSGNMAAATQIDNNGNLIVPANISMTGNAQFFYTPNGSATGSPVVRAGFQLDGANQSISLYTANIYRGGLNSAGALNIGGGGGFGGVLTVAHPADDAWGNEAASTAWVRNRFTAGLGQSFGDPGWAKLPGGLIIQWANIYVGDISGVGVQRTISWPIAFPTACTRAWTDLEDPTQDIRAATHLMAKDRWSATVSFQEWAGVVQNSYITVIGVGC